MRNMRERLGSACNAALAAGETVYDATRELAHTTLLKAEELPVVQTAEAIVFNGIHKCNTFVDTTYDKLYDATREHGAKD